MAMKRYYYLLALLFLFKSVSPQTPANDSHWNLVWSDDFTGSSVDNTKWSKIYGWGSCSDESALTTDGSNHLFNDGILKLMTYEHSGTCFWWQGGDTPVTYSKSYTSGHLISKPAFKYGFFEIRSRFPKNYIRISVNGGIQIHNGEGFSPTFWLFPCYKNAYTGYVKYSEIDIYEIKGKTNTYTCNAHYATADSFCMQDDHLWPSWSYHSDADSAYWFAVNDGAFHIYAMEWDSLSIKYYFDGDLVCEARNGTFFVPGNLLPMNIIVANSAYSSNNGIPVSQNTILPYSYDIDYVRVYNLECDEDVVIDEILDYRNYYHSVKKSISMGSSTFLPTDTTIFLRATDYIELKTGFTSPDSSQLNLIIDSSCGNATSFNYPW